VPWEKVLELLVVNRLVATGREFRLHGQWSDCNAMAELLEVDLAVAEKDRLYRCLDRLLEHKPELLVCLQRRWQDLFGAEFDVLLYDLTSTTSRASRFPKRSTVTAKTSDSIAGRW
jgi:hypothetical protein